MKRGLLFLSLFFFVLHASVPHRHHDELTESEHQKEHQTQHHFLGYFSLAFHNNLGSHHLQDVLIAHSFESFSNIQKEAFFTYQSPNWAIYQALKSKKKGLIVYFGDKKSTSFFQSDGLRRGPPVLLS